MLPRINSIKTVYPFKLLVTFDKNETVLYDVEEDINAIRAFEPLRTETGLFQNYSLDKSRTCITWSESIDLPSDMIYEYGVKQ